MPNDVTERESPSTYMSDRAIRTVALAIDLGGTKVEAALVAADGTIKAGSRHRTPTGPTASRSQLDEAIIHVTRGALEAVGADELLGCGIGSAGPLRREDDSIWPINLPALHGLRITELISPAMAGRPIMLRLDGTCIALAEHWLGGTRGASNAMSMVVSTGVGGGIILDGRPLRGDTGNAGHIGQIQVHTHRPGRSNAAASLEGIASGPRSVRWARKRGWHGCTGEDLARDYAVGDPVAVAAIRRSATAVGEAIASVATLLDLHRVTIGGGFSRSATDYVDIVQTAAVGASVVGYARDVVVTPSALGADGPLIGAAALVHRSDVLVPA
ncbi:ROK family protein [Humibacter ginsenosidimutans]|uniref:ROK family protein n=1 Tax=Humibacter ginsenosidimutans TaxID=2599293 RepID=UPI001FEF0F11|nr:ROK family protein [Humibacter ginsenosidimutans]